MTTDRINRAVAQFLAADRPDLDRLQFIRRLAGVGRSIGRGGPIDPEEREKALLMIQDQQPHRAWNRSRLSEARLVIDCYRGYEEVVSHLENLGLPYTWHDFLSALRKWRDGKPLVEPRRRNIKNLGEALSQFARQRGMSVHTIERSSGRVTVTFSTHRPKKS